MRRVFQDFIFNFFRLEQNTFSVSSERIGWDTGWIGGQNADLIPRMLTDVSLSAPHRKLVIECKFSLDCVQEQWGKFTARSDHLYQLFAYLKNLERAGGVNMVCEGILLYPTVTRAIDLRFKVQGHLIRVTTLNLNQHWREIRRDLFSLLEPPPPICS